MGRKSKVVLSLVYLRISSHSQKTLIFSVSAGYDYFKAVALQPREEVNFSAKSRKKEKGSMKYGTVTMGQVEAIINKLGGEDGMKRFLSGELVVERKFNIWKTIKLGTGLKSADDFRKAFKDGGFRVSDCANDILGKPTFVVGTEETEIDLVVVSVADLSFKRGATREDIYKRAKEFGLELCPPEVGPQLRLQYRDQPNGEWVLVGMEPITASDGNLDVFDAGHDDSGLWLGSYWGNPGYVWLPGVRWVFRLPRK